MSNWLSPALLLGILLSVGYASLFHLWRGRHLGDLLLALPIAAIGFSAGQLIGLVAQTSLLQVGQLHLLEASIGAWLALFGVRALLR
jgi:hypothetical protein